MPVHDISGARRSGGARNRTEALIQLGHLADRRCDLRLVLATDFRARPPGSSSGTRRASPATSGPAPRRRAGPTSTSCGGPIWDTLNIATLGTIIALMHGGAGGVSGGAQHHAVAALHPAHRAADHRLDALDQLADLGAAADRDHRARRVRRRSSPSRSARSGSAPSCSTRRSRKSTKPRSRRSPPPGASRWQVMAYGIVPQILPAFAGISVFRWDINIRESTVLGLVGAGGIGLQLSGLAEHAGLAAGVADPAGDPGGGRDQRMGLGQGARRDYLKVRRSRHFTA